MSSKRRTDLKIWPSKAKNLEELDSDVRKTLAPRKSTENNEKPKKKKKNPRKQKNRYQKIKKALGEPDFDVKTCLSSLKSIKNNEKLSSEIVKNLDFFFFYVFGTGKGRSSLKLWQLVVLDVPMRLARPKN